MADRVASVILVMVVQATIFPPSIASTHWVVTEDGMITQQLDSVYSLRKPYDLVEFIRQAERSQNVQTLQEELLNQKIKIDENDEKSDTNIEAKLYETDPDCMIAEKSLPEYDLYTSTVLPLENKGIKVEDHMDMKAKIPKKLRQPNCTVFMDLPYSVHAFDHLQGVQDRINLTNNPEPGLRSAISYKDDPSEFGHLVYKSLQKNKTSWVLFNLAAFYWRIKGNSFQVIECCRRALHFSPRQHKDVALINMANVLHRARHSADAAVLVHASLDVSTDLNVNHFTLGNIYAVLGEYNKSVLCFEQTTEHQPDFEAAWKRKHAVRCQEKLEVALEEQHDHLQRTLSELQDYQKKHEYFQDQRKILMDHEQATEVQFELNIKYQQQRLRDGVGETQKCHINDDAGRQVLVCKKVIQPASEAYGTVVDEKDIQASDENDWQLELLKRIDDETEDLVEDVELKEEIVDEETTSKKSTKLEPDPNAEYRTKEWPRKTDCDMNYKGLPIWKEYESTYLPPENKGIEVKQMLTEDLGLISGPWQEHPLPWYPPVCVHTDDLTGVKTSVDKIDGIANRERIPIKMPDHNIKKTLLQLVNEGAVTEEEVGQRLLTGLKKNLSNKWILYTVAGLYWRVIGNNYHGVECLRRAVHFAPEENLDVPLVNLANIMQRVGNHKDAGILLKRALAVNDTEAVTHFTYGNVLAAKGNYSGAAHEYIRALDINPQLEPALKTLHTLRCHEKFHCAAKSSTDENSDSAMCQRPDRSSSGATSSSSQTATERRVVCHHVQGVEQCQLETRQRKVVNADDGSCSSICTTTCNSPPSREICSEPNGISGNRKCQVCTQCEENKAFQCHSASTQQCISDALEIIEIGEDDLSDLEDFEESLELFAPVAKALSEEQRVVNLKSSDTEGKKMVTVNLKTSSTSKTKQTSTTNGNGNKNHSKDINKSKQSNGGGKSDANTPTLTGPQIPGTQQLKLIAAMIENSEHPWPSLEECKDIKKINLKSFTSTWLSVTAKEVDLRDHLNFDDDIEEIILEPFCQATIGPSLFTLDHLKGLAERDKIEYAAEQGLKEVLETLGGDFESYLYIGTRLNIAISFNQTSWVLTNMAALYWRVQGDAEKALDCLRQGLFFSPRPVRDIALISMANIFHRAGLYEDALVVTKMAMEISPNLVVIHFTMANIYSAMGDLIEAMQYYESTLTLQPEFQPAVERLNTIKCQLLQYQKNSKK